MGAGAVSWIVPLVFSTFMGLRNQQAAKQAASKQAASMSQAMASLAPPPAPSGPTVGELESQKQAEDAKIAKDAAEKRTADLEAGIKADTEAAKARQLSLVSSSSTIKTTAYGLTGRAPTEKKTLLGAGGAY